MRIEPDDEGGVENFVVAEDGIHEVCVGSVRPSQSRDGQESWMLRVELVEGALAGRTAVTDWLNFGARGMHRVRLVLSALGLDVSAGLDIEPDELVGLRARVELETQESVRPGDGRLVRRSRVPYDGWSPSLEGRGGSDGGSDDGSDGGPLVESAQEPDRRGGGSTGSFAADQVPF